MEQHLWGGIIAYIFKRRAAKTAIGNFEQIIAHWLTELERQEGFDFAKTVIKYTLNVIDKHDIHTFVAKLVPHLSNSLEDETMTLADQLRHEGIQQATQRIVKNLLQCGALTFQQIATITGLSLEDVNKLKEKI